MKEIPKGAIMLNTEPFLRFVTGETDTAGVLAKHSEEDGVTAVYAYGASSTPLDPDFGMGIYIDVGKDIESVISDYKQYDFWCTPFFGTDFSDVPDETQALIYRKTDGIFGVILPVVDKEFKCVLKTENGRLCARIFNWYDKTLRCDTLAFLHAEGEDVSVLMEACFRTALRLLNNGIRHRTERRYPEIFEYLGWCTWDAMQIRVCEEGLLEKCREFREKQIPVKWAILDDMWAEVKEFQQFRYSTRDELFQILHRGSLYSFEADHIRFPQGLGHTIEKMNGYGLRVGMWHPTTGYWSGLDPNGDAYAKVRDYLIETPNGFHIPDWKTPNAYMFYKTFHDFLRQCGAEFVKIDNQSMTRRYYKNLAPVGKVARSFHDAMEASVGEHFDNAMINCMGMSGEDIWTRSVSPISRCSGDFQPENAEWFVEHILMCSYNSLVQGQLYWCDWDMWWTDDGQAVKNSILRAVSGGPIYVSDMIGRSNKALLDPLALSDGRILRCDRCGVPTNDCVTTDPRRNGKIFKIQNIASGYGILAAFHLDAEGRNVSGSISPSDVYDLCGEEFAVFEHFSRKLRIMKREERFSLSLTGKDDFRLYVIAPLHNGFAPLGLIDKFISPKAIRCVIGETVALSDGGTYGYVRDGKLYTEKVPVQKA